MSNYPQTHTIVKLCKEDLLYDQPLNKLKKKRVWERSSVSFFFFFCAFVYWTEDLPVVDDEFLPSKDNDMFRFIPSFRCIKGCLCLCIFFADGLKIGLALWSSDGMIIGLPLWGSVILLKKKTKPKCKAWFIYKKKPWGNMPIRIIY